MTGISKYNYISTYFKALSLQQNIKTNLIMKILHIDEALNASGGGETTFLLGLLPAIKKAGNDVEVLVLMKDQADYAPQLEQQGIRVHIGKYHSYKDPRNILLLRRYIQDGGYDVIHTHLFLPLYWVAIAKMFTKNNAKFVDTLHMTYYKRMNYPILRRIERTMYRQYHQIICVGNDAKINLEKWLRFSTKNCTKSLKINTIVNGIDLQKFRTALPYSKRELGIPNNAKVILMVARFNKQKDHKTAIQALAALNDDVHLLLCGNEEQPLLNDCKQLAIDLCISNRVHFLGNRTDIERLMKSSDIGILSTFYEGLNITILEYMAAGLPVVASDVDGVREVVKDYGILFSAEDHVELAQKVTQLLDNKKYYDEISEKCCCRSLDFSYEKMVENYLKLYKELCNKN
jgi:glycosyltransferase involved in cell wall biosynthesis